MNTFIVLQMNPCDDKCIFPVGLFRLIANGQAGSIGRFNRFNHFSAMFSDNFGYMIFRIN